MATTARDGAEAGHGRAHHDAAAREEKAARRRRNLGGGRLLGFGAGIRPRARLVEEERPRRASGSEPVWIYFALRYTRSGGVRAASPSAPKGPSQQLSCLLPRLPPSQHILEFLVKLVW